MDTKLLQTLFVDNPELQEHILDFCRALPEYNQAREAFIQTADKLVAQVSIQDFDAFYHNLITYQVIENQAHYLFGLGLREEIIRAMAL